VDEPIGAVDDAGGNGFTPAANVLLGDSFNAAADGRRDNAGGIPDGRAVPSTEGADMRGPFPLSACSSDRRSYPGG
jgi:hypothetical protein